jgi:hypothetical protein
MTRKRREGITTYPRYRGKAYSVAFGIFHDQPELAKEYADALALARASGYGVFKTAYHEAIPVLQREGVSSKLWGLMKAFINELINKAQVRKTKTVDDIINDWAEDLKTLADPEPVLRAIAETVVQVYEKEASKAPAKGA